MYCPRLLHRHRGAIHLHRLQTLKSGRHLGPSFQILSVASMVVAGVVEKMRRKSAVLHGCDDGAAPLSVMWLAPQLALLHKNREHLCHVSSPFTLSLVAFLPFNWYAFTFMVCIHRDDLAKLFALISSTRSKPISEEVAVGKGPKFHL